MERTSSLRRKTSDGVLAKASNFGQMLEDVRKLALSKSLWDDEMQRDLPKKWEKHGDMIVFPQNTFTHINWRYIGRELWAVVAQSLNVARVGRKRQIDDDRTAHVDLLFGADAWVDYVDERGIKFCYNATVRVFDNSKKAEMKRISKWACQGQTIVDMYSSLGYYSLTFLVSCEAKQVVAIDWNDEILESLIRSAQVNHVDDRLLVLHGDCRRVCPDQAADRVYLGLLPSCRAHWLAACKALKAEGEKEPEKEKIVTEKKKKTVEGKEKTDKENVPKKKKVLRQKTLPVLSAVHEDSKPETESTSTSSEPLPPGEPNTVPESNGTKVKIWKEYENEGWSRLTERHREFAKDCAHSCTRFLNNIHLSDIMYSVTVVNMIRYGEVSKGKEHIVLELLCCQQDASTEHLISKFNSENLKS
uniref:tRNA wybutosine-synthesizing protein 2 homolog n=1 Tax=Caenorhabditis tropicalis TaxID=1561998 RepID=A0A1I7UN47_9PELO